MHNQERQAVLEISAIEKREAMLVWRDAHDREISATTEECDERIQEYALSMLFSVREFWRDLLRLTRAITKRISLWINT